jgi:polysaccharide export outer membrane protein
MTNQYTTNILIKLVMLLYASILLHGCASTNEPEETTKEDATTPYYLIGAGDTLNLFIWGNPDLSGEFTVRPDGRLTTPLVEDVVASGRTPSQLARVMEQKLSRYIKNPVVTVTVTGFVGRHDEQIRIVGEVTTPLTIPYRENITVLDVVIAAGGLTEFAAGNRATIARTINSKRQKISVRLKDLVTDGDLSANIRMYPGDVLFVPEAWF